MFIVHLTAHITWQYEWDLRTGKRRSRGAISTLKVHEAQSWQPVPADYTLCQKSLHVSALKRRVPMKTPAWWGTVMTTGACWLHFMPEIVARVCAQEESTHENTSVVWYSHDNRCLLTTLYARNRCTCLRSRGECPWKHQRGVVQSWQPVPADYTLCQKSLHVSALKRRVPMKTPAWWVRGNTTPFPEISSVKPLPYDFLYAEPKTNLSWLRHKKEMVSYSWKGHTEEQYHSYKVITARPTSCDKLRSCLRTQVAGTFYLEIRSAEKCSALRFIVKC